MRIHTIIDIKRPDRIIDVRHLMLSLDQKINVGLSNGDVAEGFLRGFEMMSDRMVILTVDIHSMYAYLFPDEQVDDHDDVDEFEDWYDYSCMDVEED